MLKKEQLTMLKDMGFSKEEIERAAKIANEKNIDIIDVLTKPASNPSIPPPPANAKAPRQTSSFAYRPMIKPREHIPMDQYECIYRENDTSALMGQDDRREDGIPVALKNVSNCCYLNSLLQMFFLMPKFVEIVLNARPIPKEELDKIVPNGIRNKRIFNSFGLLRSLQQLYSNMILTTKKALDPSDILRNMVDSLGNKISYGQEKDLSEISLQLISRLQECVIYTEGMAPQVASSWNESPEKEKDQFTSVLSKTVSPLKDLLFGDKIEISNDSEETKIESKFFGILLNPVHENLYKALDQQFHFKIEHEGKLTNKDVWITREPEYLFFYIQRTNYDKQLGVVKMKDKIQFDFDIYIDRYLFKNKHKQEQKNPILQQNIKRRDETIKQISHANALKKALSASHHHLSSIKNPPFELPAIEPIDGMISELETLLSQTDEAISKLESREERYTLRFIIVHRGEADSGHYWGYGFVNASWWKFDIHNSKVDKASMVKEIESGDVVVYALVYARHQETYHPSYSLYLNDDDLLAVDNNYNQFVSEQTKAKILAENKQREKLHEDRKSAESISIITLEYEERFRNINEAVRKYREKYPKIPLLSNFSAYLRCVGGEDPSQYFKTHLLDIAIRSCTKHSLKDMPNEQFRGQLTASFRQNLSKYSAPEKYALGKPELDRLNEKFNEYLSNISAASALQRMFDNIFSSNLEEAAECAYFAIKLGTKNYLQKVARETLAVLTLALAAEGKRIPSEYLAEIGKAEKRLSEQLAAVTEAGGNRDKAVEERLHEVCKVDKKKEKELYLWPAEAKLVESTGERLTEQIKKSMGVLGKAIRMYNKITSSDQLPKKQDIFG